ncbi:MAG: sigma-70 family RNA polymerase sigma factor [Planctomycetes bacterium]|nr:sigma-70 family RNA polymerase sigma factor [Planctomycetota bacterium]
MIELTCEPTAECQQGTMIDWNAALAEHGRWLRTVVLARVGEPQAVDDVMQELALAVVKRPPSLVDAGKVGPWLYRVAVAQSIRYRRGRARQRHGLARYAERCGDNGDGREGDEVADPLRLLIAEERRQIVEHALGRLPGRDAEILLLKYTEHWSYRQLSERLGISESAVDGRLQRARERLRRELASLDLSEER